MTASSDANQTIEICDVGPRDGLQSEERLWSVDERVELINRLIGAGLKRIEAVSFVNPKRVPQMAEAEAVVEGIDRSTNVRIAGLALNARGAERAIAAEVDEVRFVVIASETFNQKNQGASISQTLDGFDAVAEPVRAAGIRLSGVIGASFGCPFEGAVGPDKVADIAGRLAERGAEEIGLADTIGSAVPTQLIELYPMIADAVGEGTKVGFHLHNTRNTGFANAATAASLGADFLDASVGGLGGCPFAPAATGNISTEDLCFMLRNMGYETGIDLDALIEVARWTEGFFDEPLPGQVMKAGLFPEVAKRAAG